MKSRKLLYALACLLISSSTLAQQLFSSLSSEEKALYKEHIVKGQPDGTTPVLVRHAYVAHYNPKYRIPDWVSYHAIVPYLQTPARSGKFKSFRTDPDIQNEPVVDDDYVGAGYARGHMAPYFIMGGHREDGDSEIGKFDPDSQYDQTTVFQANYLSNIAPQHQLGLNGPGGAWYALETAIRTKLLKKHEMELHVIVGPIFNDPNKYKTIKSKINGETKIAIADNFFQVIVFYNKDTKEYITAGFIFEHVKKKPKKALIKYLVPVDDIEAKTGLDFLNELPKAEQAKTESKPNLEFWEKRLQ
jgi:endonuclease G